jgi:hypothetical protein
MDTAALCRHATCYSIYLVATLTYFTSYTAWAIAGGDDNRIFLFAQAASIFYWSGSMVSEILLCYIFWDVLSEQVGDDQTEADTASDRNSTVAVELEEFDEEAELNAKIWNNFMKKCKEDDNEVEGPVNRYMLSSNIMSTQASIARFGKSTDRASASKLVFGNNSYNSSKKVSGPYTKSELRINN